MDARSIEFAAADAKARFSELLTRAERGQEVLITRHGKVVAKMTAAADQTARREEAQELAWNKFVGDGRPTLGPDLTIRQLISEGRRY